MRSLPSSRRLPSLPWVVLSIGMNLKNFPNRLDSKTSCLRITVPENLDLALEGLIRKVLKEQPKMDDIYAFAADYFDLLLKIRDKVGTKFAANQLCPFHNDEDAHEMIKLASIFSKPGIPKAKTPETEKTKARKKELSKSTEKSNKTIQKVKQPVATQKKPQRLTGKKTDQKLNETEPERPKTLKLEPMTEDVGDDEEFLKSDAIKVLVEKELMDAAKSGSKDKKKERTDDAETQKSEKPEEGNANEELCLVVDKDNVKTEIQKADEFVNKAKEETKESDNATKDKKEDTKEEEENKSEEKTEMETQNGKKDVEAVTEVTYSIKDTAREEIKKELRDHRKGNYEEVLAKTQNNNLEIETGSDHIQSIKSLAAEKETQTPLENEPKTKAKSKDTEINKEAPKETAEKQEIGKSKLFEEKIEDVEKDKETVQVETEDNSKDRSLEGELNLNSDELCAVVDILSIKSLEKHKPNTEEVKEAKVEEPKCKKEEGIDEVNIQAEEQEEVLEVQKSMKAIEECNEFTLANQVEGENPHVKITDEPSEMVNLVESLKPQIDSENNKLDMKTTMKDKEIEKIDTSEIKPVPSGDQKSTEDDLKDMRDNETKPASKLIKDYSALEEKEKREEPKIATENEAKSVEEQLKLKEKPAEALENKDPEKEEAGKETEIKTEHNDIKFAESSEEALEQIKTKIKNEEPNQNYRKTEGNKDNLQLEQVNFIKNERQSSDVKEEQIILPEIMRQPDMEKELQNEELKPTEETVSDEMEVSDDGNIYEQKNNVTGAVKKSDIVDKADETIAALLKDSEKEKSPTIRELIKPLDDSEQPETADTNTVESTERPETNQTPQQFTGETGNEQFPVGGAQHVIKVEEAEETPHPEGVQIKTIQTHYYDTLQVPEQVTKEYRVHSVKNVNVVDNLLNITNVILPSDEGQATETAAPLLDPTKEEDQEMYKRDLEKSLMTPSSNYSLNLSELSIQTINEMFLNSEKQYSAQDKEERKYETKTGEKCGDESRMEKREVEEIIHRTTVPSAAGATAIAPRDDAEINEEASTETGLNSEIKQETSLDSYERAVSSNEGKSTDSDTPIISVEVKTVIETQILEDEEKKKEGSGPTGGDESDVQIRVEARIDVPEGVTVDVREEKENKDELRQCANDEPQTSETVSKDSQTSSGESESTTSSTATEIKRNDSNKRHFSSNRTLNTTQSLDLDKRNPLLKTRSLSSFRQGVTDFEVWNAIEKELEEAATKIQSNFRGYKTRKKLQRGNAVHITTEESSCSATSVEPEPDSKLRVEQQQSTGEFHDSIVLSEHPR